MARENAREKFVELTEKRVRKAIKDIKLIGNLSNRNNYSYTGDDARKIVRALTNEIKTLEDRFRNSNGVDDVDFKL